MLGTGTRNNAAGRLHHGWLIVGAALVLVVGVCGFAIAYDQYTTGTAGTNCAACHGDFRANSYNSLKDGTDWDFGGQTGLHNVHRRAMLNGTCDACHGSGGNFPVQMGASVGDSSQGIGPNGCVNCHGREADGTGTGTEGWGAGLRQHHWNADGQHPTMDLKVCLDCHSDSDPAAFAPVGENVNPPLYGNTSVGLDIPDDACNPGPAFEEDYSGSGPDETGPFTGLDNDGDNVFDTNDPDCSAATGAGEALSLVADKSSTPGVITVSWTGPCNSVQHKIEYGNLANVSSYTYAGQECNLLTPAGYDWTYPGSPQNLFFLIVADNGTSEGSYGKCSAGVGCGVDDERPDDDVNTTCTPNLDQDLAGRCD